MVLVRSVVQIAFPRTTQPLVQAITQITTATAGVGVANVKLALVLLEPIKDQAFAFRGVAALPVPALRMPTCKWV